MSWLYSQALVVEYSVGICSAGAQCAPLNLTPTQQAYCSQDKMTEFSRLSRFGMMFAPLMDDRGEELLMSFLEDSRAKTFHPLESEKELTAREVDYGKTWQGSLAKYDQDSHSWKTAQCSLFGGLETYSETWPRWGLMLNGECWAVMMLEATTNENESGLWPTPRACNPGSRPNGKGGRVLAEEVAIAEGMKKRGEPGSAAGLISPEWVELLMGWPLGWTDLQPLAMDKFREYERQHGECLTYGEAANV